MSIINIAASPSPSADPGRDRLPVLLAVVLLHGLVVTLLLRPAGTAPSATAPIALDMQIVSEPRIRPAPPPLKPVTLANPRIAIEVPAPVISITEPQTLTAVVQPTVAVTPTPAATPAPDVPIAPPRFDASYLHNPAPEYPAAARRQHAQGVAMLRVHVSSQGEVLEILIEHSSGWPLLDAAASEAVKRWRFLPGKQGSEAVAAWVLVPIEFDLRR